MYPHLLKLCVLVYMLLDCSWAQSCTIICLTDKQTQRKTYSYTSHHTEAPYKSLWTIQSN